MVVSTAINVAEQKGAEVSAHGTFFSKRSFLFKKRIRLVCWNHFELLICAKSSSASSRRFFVSSSNKTWSNSDSDATKTTALTLSKQWIHFRLSLRWPPTSNLSQEQECGVSCTYQVVAIAACTSRLPYPLYQILWNAH